MTGCNSAERSGNPRPETTQAEKEEKKKKKRSVVLSFGQQSSRASHKAL